MANPASWNGPRWELWGKVDSAWFFKSLASTFPEATTLFLEGTPCPDVDDFLRSAADPGPYLPDRGTTWPKGNLYRLRFGASTLTSLAELAERHAEPEILDHLHVFAGEVPLLDWHDAFARASPLRVSATIDRERILEFSTKLGFDPWQFPRPDQPLRDARNRVLAGVGVSILVLWAAAVASYFVLGMLAWREMDPGRRVGGAAGHFGAFLCEMAFLCGLVLLAASFAKSVRAVRALRWLVVVGLIIAWSVPVIGLLGILD